MPEAAQTGPRAGRSPGEARARWRAQSLAAARRPAWLPAPVYRLATWLFGRLLWVGLGGLLAAALLRLTLRDHIPGLANFYYAFPPLVLCGLAMLWAVFFAWWRRWRGALATLCLGGVCAGWGYATTWFHNSPAPAAGPSCRVMFWNVAHGALGWPGVVAAIRGQRPDLVGLVEAGRDCQRTYDFLARELPGYYVYAGPMGFALLARGPVERTAIELRDHALFHKLRVDLPQMPLDVVLVDLLVSFRKSRGPSLRGLAESIVPGEGQPVIVMGDFNTPLDSVFFDRLRQDYVNAFETAGSGYAATWPLPLPVLTLDQIWLSPALRATACWTGAEWCSDHRWVQAEITRRVPRRAAQHRDR